MSRVTSRTTALMVLAAGLLVSNAAWADGPRCSDAKGGDKPGICGQFESAPKASLDDPNVIAALKVWERVRMPFTALTGRTTGINVLAREARYQSGGEEQAFPPAAYICPGGPPVVYVPYTLLELVYEKKQYEENFLAFVFGHELGHRLNDITIDGCQLAAFQRPGKGRHEEELADNRGAFFAAVAGFSTRTLAGGDIVSQFLEAEFQVGRHGVKKRREALLDALEHFDTYEHLYQTAVSLTFGGEIGAATRLLEWADQLVEGRGVPLPELKLVRGLTLMMSVAPQAPAWAEGRHHPAISALRCKPVFPEHSALWEKPVKRRVRSGGDKPEATLRLARRLIDDAAELGANDLVVASGRACIALYSGEVDDAKRLFGVARRLAGKKAPEAVSSALDSNVALADFVAFLKKNPLPPATDAAAAKKWTRGLRKVKRLGRANAEVGDVVARMKAYPTVERAPKPEAPVCKGGSALSLGRPPSMPGELGQCPSGWALAHSVPTTEAGKQAGSNSGITTCMKVGAEGTSLTRIRLPGSMSPRLEEVDITVRSIENPTGAVQSLDNWACSCKQLSSRGASDIGSQALEARCKRAGANLGVLFVDPAGRVSRVVSFHL